MNDAEGLTLISSALESQILTAQREHVEHIRINQAHGYAEKDISVLSHMPWIKHLEVSSRLVTDWSPLLLLYNLHTLRVDGAPDIDLSRLPSLQVVNLEWHRNQNLGSCANLVAVALAGLAVDDLGYFAQCVSLQSLTLIAPMKISSLSGLRNTNLFRLCVSMLHKRALDLNGVAGAPHLIELEISKVAAVAHLAELRKLASLYTLLLADVRAGLEGIGELLRIPSLQDLRLVGTRIRDGNLDRLQDLKWATIDDRRHYSITSKSLDAILRAKGGGSLPQPDDYQRHRADVAARRHAVVVEFGLRDDLHDSR